MYLHESKLLSCKTNKAKVKFGTSISQFSYADNIIPPICLTCNFNSQRQVSISTTHIMLE